MLKLNAREVVFEYNCKTQKELKRNILFKVKVFPGSSFWFGVVQWNQKMLL